MEGQEGIKFRNDCEKLFYNSSFFIRIEHPIIKIKGYDIKDSDQKQDFKFVIDGTRDLKYNKEKKDGGEFCNDEMGIKQINFGVTDFRARCSSLGFRRASPPVLTVAQPLPLPFG